MGPRLRRRRHWSARRLFAAYAVVTVVPVLVLGAILTSLLRGQANDRGLAEGTAQARLIARSTVAPLLDGNPTTSLASGEYSRLEHTVHAATGEKQILRVRLRSLDGRIVFPADEASSPEPVDDEALDAARGTTVAKLTRLNADEPDQSPGPRVVEVYLPLTNVQAGTRIGVLELYLPYDPIAADIALGQRSVYLALVTGLALLWLCLIAVTASVIRHLRRETRAHAYLANHDKLTALPNREHFVRLLDSELTTSSASVWVAVLTVERLRKVSDALGQSNADAVLVTLARRLHEKMSPLGSSEGAAARLDGAEFAVFGSRPQVHDWLLGLRASLRTPIAIDGLPVAVDVTIGYDIGDVRSHGHRGVATDNVDAQTLIARAGLARTAASQGSVGIAKYDPIHNHHDASALTLIAEIEAAILADELILHFQPKLDLTTDRVSSVEALVRWQHPSRGLLFPGAFLDAVEETELIDNLTAWVVRHACRAARQLETSVRVAVNVSARNLMQPEFASDLMDIIRQEGVTSDRIILEVTETAVVTDPVRARRTLSQLRGNGLAISVDDFGAGQTSLSQLVAAPIDELKIDRAFVADMIDNPRSAAIVRAVIELGHSLGVTVTAEGVETKSVLTRLTDLGCDVAQGFYLSRPLPLSELLNHLKPPFAESHKRTPNSRHLRPAG